MWKLIKISQQTSFINCNFTSAQEVIFILYDLKETWCQTFPFQEVKQKVKQLNKRYDFSEDNIKETLLNGDLETATIEQQPHTSSTKQENCVIKLKYRIKNCPFNLELSLRRQTLEEFQATFMQPLFSALFGCYQQVEILTDILRKKDAELIQYRKEGAVLHRKTLATKPFDFDEFSKKYQASTELAINYTELAKFLINTTSKMEHAPFTCSAETKKAETKLDIPPEKKLSSTNNVITKLSPKQRKRKVQEMKQQQLERHLKVRIQQFKYESSQSQTTNSSNSQTNDETLQTEIKHKDAKDQSQKKETESDSDNHSTPRRRITRCIPVKNYQENKSDVDKSDTSDFESDAHNIRSLRERKTTRICISTREKEKSLNIDKNEKSIISNTKNNENMEKISKSPTPNKKLQSSNNVNYLSKDSEYKPTSYERKTFLKTSPNTRESRKNRSAPQCTKPSIDNKIAQSQQSPLWLTPIDDKSKNLSHPSTPIADDITSQLDAIKKELQSLEALRLADLQKRMCKT